MHTLYMVYDENNKVVSFKIDAVSTAKNFISLDRGPLSYVQSIVDNFNNYVKKNGNLTMDSAYITQIRHGNFDQTYGTIEDKRTEDPKYVSQSNTPTSASSNSQSAASSDSQTSNSEAASSANSQAASSSDSATKDTSTTNTTSAAPAK